MAVNDQRIRPRRLTLGLADPPIVVPEAVFAEGLERNRRSLIGRILCPRKLDLHQFIHELPYEWHVDYFQVHGRVIGNRKFQFLFDTERDLEMVLWSGPYTYKGWLVVLQRWEDEQGPDYLQSVPMWVSIRGIPVQYLCEGTIREIVSYMGEVMEVERGDYAASDLRSVRVRVDVDVNSRICFKRVVRFGSRETKVVSLRYEDIACNTAVFRHCRNCGGLTHSTKSCSYVWVDVPDPNEPPLSPPPSDSSHENDAADGEDLQQGLVSVEEGNAIQVRSEMVGSSSDGSKRKFEAVEEEEKEEADDNLEKRMRGSDGLMVNIKSLQQE